jgi:hypothetical protein
VSHNAGLMMHVQDRSVGPARDRERDRLPGLAPYCQMSGDTDRRLDGVP